VPFITAANVEAEAAEYGVGIIRLMGKQCGNLALAASLASRDVNICVVPELAFQIYGKDGVYESVIERCIKKGHCIIVISEGAFNGLVDEDKKEVLQKAGTPDAKEFDLAPFFKKDIAAYAKSQHGISLTLKYLDPKTAIRACPANAEDSRYALSLGLSAVNSAMAGYTDFSVGCVRSENTMIPFETLKNLERRIIKRKDVDWQRLLMSTGQSDFLSPENQIKYGAREREEQLRRKEKYIDSKL
jgi:6-phosphofructokinase 1